VFGQGHISVDHKFVVCGEALPEMVFQRGFMFLNSLDS
jgi:hypothetical protein